MEVLLDEKISCWVQRASEMNDTLERIPHDDHRFRLYRQEGVHTSAFFIIKVSVYGNGFLNFNLLYFSSFKMIAFKFQCMWYDAQVIFRGDGGSSCAILFE